jgi:hypothetical protein
VIREKGDATEIPSTTPPCLLASTRLILEMERTARVHRRPQTDAGGPRIRQGRRPPADRAPAGAGWATSVPSVSAARLKTDRAGEVEVNWCRQAGQGVPLPTADAELSICVEDVGVPWVWG